MINGVHVVKLAAIPDAQMSGMSHTYVLNANLVVGNDNQVSFECTGDFIVDFGTDTPLVDKSHQKRSVITQADNGHAFTVAVDFDWYTPWIRRKVFNYSVQVAGGLVEDPQIIVDSDC